MSEVAEPTQTQRKTRQKKQHADEPSTSTVDKRPSIPPTNAVDQRPGLRTTKSILETVLPGHGHKEPETNPPTHRSHDVGMMRTPLQPAPAATMSGTHSAVITKPQGAARVEEVTQFALNSSILSGSFENIKIFSYSQKFASQSGRVGTARPLYANSTLLRRALSHTDLGTSYCIPDSSDTLNVSLASATLDNVKVGEEIVDSDLLLLRMSSYDYPDDSDLEECEEDVGDEVLEHARLFAIHEVSPDDGSQTEPASTQEAEALPTNTVRPSNQGIPSRVLTSPFMCDTSDSGLGSHYYCHG